MNPSLEINVDWPTNRARSSLEQAELSIWIDGACATSVEEVLDRTRRNRVRLSVTRLAEWLAGNWWRLRWEPEIPKEARPDAISDWNMSHNLASAGGGYVWPALWFSSDGDSILIRSESTEPDLAEPIRYLGNFTKTITANSFEQEVDRFVEATIANLAKTGQEPEDLSTLWKIVSEERQDSGMSETRKLEALLGYDPAEAPGNLIEALLEQARRYGSNAVEELAAHSKAQTLVTLEALTNQALTGCNRIQIPDSKDFIRRLQTSSGDYQVPWERGENAARMARNIWRIDQGPISDEDVARLFGPSCTVSTDPGCLPISAGLRENGSPDEFQAYLRQQSRAGRRFALSRLVADHLTSQPEDSLLPATDSKTSRQKFQRAFAREFLCPFKDLQEFIGPNTPGRDEIEYAAEHFQVSEWAIANTLVYKGIIDRAALFESGI